MKAKDLTNQRFGRLTAICRVEDHVSCSGKHSVQWKCLCDCNRETVVTSAELLRGKTKSCGLCDIGEKYSSSVIKGDNGRLYPDLTGMVFGRLTVIGRAESREKNGTKVLMWKCRCSCGNPEPVNVTGIYLRNGITRSCGCLQEEMNVEFGTSKKLFNRYEWKENYVIGYTGKDEPFYIDKQDYELISNLCWSQNSGYLHAYDPETRKNVSMSRLITNPAPGMHVDHINHMTNDNRRCNLRVVSAGYNARNRTVAKNNTSKVTGVSWNKQKKKWTAAISFQGHTYYLGAYVLFDEAVAARKAAEEKYFGAYSYDNSIEAVPRVERDPLNDGAAEGATPIAAAEPFTVAASMPILAVSAPVLVVKEAPGHQPSALMKEESPMAQVPNHHVHFTGRTIRTSSTMI